MNFACEVMGNLCSAYLNAQQIDSALFYSYKHLEISRKIFGKINHYTADIYSNLARTYLGKGMADSSIFYFNNALDVYQKQNGEKGFKAGSYHYFKAEIFISSKEYEKALECLEQSMMSFVEDYPNTSDYSYLPPVKNYPLIRAIYQAAYRKLFVFRQLYESDSTVKWLNLGYEHTLFIDSIENILLQSSVNNQFMNSINTTKSLYSSAAKNAFELYCETLSADHYQAVYHFASILKSRVLAYEIFKLENQQQFEKNNLSFETTSFIDKKKLEEDIKILNSELVAAKADHKYELADSIHSKIIDKEINLFAVNQNVGNKSNENMLIDLSRFEVKIENIKENLDTNSALVEYTISNEKLFIFCFTQDSSFIHFTYLDETFEKVLKNFMKAIKTSSKDNGQLAEILLAPILTKIAGKSHLIIIPDNKLLDVPFECLKLPGKNEMIIQNFAITYHYSTALWLNSKKKSTELSGNQSIALFAPGFENNNQSSLAYRNVVFGDSNYIMDDILSEKGKSLNALPYSIKEVKAISKILNKDWKTKVYLHKNAKESIFKEELNKNSILHIATHGMSSKSNFEQSGLFFSQQEKNTDTLGQDGFLFVSELFSLHLNANLVVLSACKSGSGQIFDGEGVYGLPRGFIYAGVPNLIVSLWKIHDEKTMELMVEFYKHISDGDSYSVALRKAKLTMIEKGELPLDWAGIVLIGR